MSTYDVSVIGAGVIGTAIARMLSHYQLSVALVDARGDVCEGTSKANTAILHTGYDAKPGTLEAKLVARGYELTGEYCAQAGIGVERRGAILVAWDEEQLAALPSLKEKAEANGYMDCTIISADDVYREIPQLGPGALGGLSVPGESIIDPWSVPLAFVTEAVNNGAVFLRNHRVESVDAGEETTILHTSAGDIETRWVINASGLGGDTIDGMFGYDRFHVHPRRGELLVFDKLSHERVPKIILPVPSKLGKGVLVSPTIFGNAMLGPTAEDMEDRTDTATTEAGFDFLLEKGTKIMPALLSEEVSATYAGLRAASDLSDYLLNVDPAQRYCVCGGIRSTGLTSAMAVAEYVEGLLRDAGLELTPKKKLAPIPHMPYLGNSGVRPYQDNERIEKDAAYGDVVCFCERVTRGEIRDACTSAVPPTSVQGIARRTRATNGRCQTFFCGGKVKELARSFGIEESKEGARS